MNRYASLFCALLVCLSAGAAKAEFQMLVRLEVNDLLGNPITSIAAGSDFMLKGIVQDLRDPGLANGVYSAFINVDFEGSLATALPPISHHNFTLVAAGTIVAGGIDGVGGASASLSPTGLGELLLFSLTIHAGQAGLVTFVPSYDMTEGHDMLVFLNSNLVPEEDVQFVSDSITIVPEPSSLAMAMVGVLGLIGWRMRRTRLRTT